MTCRRVIKAASTLVVAAGFACVAGSASAESEAERRLAIAYETLACGSYADAMPQLVRAADAGSVEAQELVGSLYLAGYVIDGGAPGGEARAIGWLRQAAEAGRADAQRLVTTLELLEQEQQGRDDLVAKATTGR